MRKWLWILLFPLVAQAAGEGTWQASSIWRDPQQPRCRHVFATTITD